MKTIRCPSLHSLTDHARKCLWMKGQLTQAKVVCTTVGEGCVLQAHSNYSRGSAHVLHKVQQTQVGLQPELAAMPAENPKHTQNSPFKLQLAANCSTAAEEEEQGTFNSI